MISPTWPLWGYRFVSIERYFAPYVWSEGEFLFTLHSPSVWSVGDFLFTLRDPSVWSVGQLLFILRYPSEQSVGELLFTLWSPSERSVCEFMFTLRSPSEHSVGELLLTLRSPFEQSVGGFHFSSYAELELLWWQFTMVFENIVPIFWDLFVIGQVASSVFSNSWLFVEKNFLIFIFVEWIAFCIPSTSFTRFFLAIK